MSEHLSFPGPFRPIDQTVVADVQARAAHSERARALVRYHDHAEPLQRMLNAIEPASYVRPHRHADPAKLEIFLALTGSGMIVAFDDQGLVTTHTLIRAGGPCWGAEIPAGTWHCLVSLEPGSVFYELIEGPYHAVNHKDFAPWAPAEGTPQATEYLQHLKEQLLP